LKVRHEGKTNALSDSIAIGEKALREGAANDGDTGVVLIRRVIKFAACEQRNSEGFEEIVPHSGTGTGSRESRERSVE
jgi:hypothetical protein